MTTEGLKAALRDLAEHGTVYLESRSDALMVAEGCRLWGGIVEFGGGGSLWRFEWTPAEDAPDA